jgi:hypothetical protein
MSGTSSPTFVVQHALGASAPNAVIHLPDGTRVQADANGRISGLTAQQYSFLLHAGYQFVSAS